MAGVKISALPAAPSAALTDIYPIVQGGVTYRLTSQQLLTLFQANLVTPADGGILYTDATQIQLLAPTATANQVLMSGANTAPHWSTPTYPTASGTAGQLIRSNGTNNVYTTLTFPDTIALNALLFGNVANNVGPIAPVNSAVFRSSSTGVPGWSASMTNGQLLIGSTGATPALGTLSAGPGVSIANGAGTITISGTGSGIGWTEVTGITQAIVADNGYVANNAGVVTLTLPLTAAFGTIVSIVGKGAGGWLIAQNAGQNIQVGSVSSSVGVGGSVASTNRFDSIDLLCTTADLTWTTLGAPQSAGLTIV